MLSYYRCAKYFIFSRVLNLITLFIARHHTCVVFWYTKMSCWEIDVLYILIFDFLVHVDPIFFVACE